jgi:hypothetical protein
LARSRFGAVHASLGCQQQDNIMTTDMDQFE